MDTQDSFNFDEALARIDGDRELFAALVEMFLEESPKEFAAAQAALTRQDATGLASAAHKLKGSVLQFCAPRLLEQVKRLEELGRKGEVATAGPLCTLVQTGLAELHHALKAAIKPGPES